MAGAFTHFLVCDIAKRSKAIEDQDLFKLLNRHAEFLFLGAVSPDLPYLCFKTGQFNWADVMHYEKTNAIALGGHAVLKRVWSKRTEADEVKYAWLLGLTSHLIADATIHPIVQAIVGPYEQNKEEHRLCEMTQDSLLYRERKGAEIRYAEFSSAVKFCGRSPYHRAVMEFWSQLAGRAHAEKNDTPDPNLWFSTYSKAIDAAEGGSGMVALFRHIGIGSGLIYRTSSELRRDSPQMVEKYYTRVNLPTGGQGLFSRDGLDRTVGNVVNAWNAMHRGLRSDVDVARLVRNWNLDTGVDMAAAGQPVTYWG
ncbi:MAG: zinc dependent phospholipase C family protein [Nitrospirota bacterium]